MVLRGLARHNGKRSHTILGKTLSPGAFCVPKQGRIFQDGRMVQACKVKLTEADNGTRCWGEGDGDGLAGLDLVPRPSSSTTWHLPTAEFSLIDAISTRDIVLLA